MTKRSKVHATRWKRALATTALLCLTAWWMPGEVASAEGDDIRITDHAARSDDGRDDTTALSRALDEAAKTGATVLIPEGTFEVRQDVTIPAGVSIEGEGLAILDGTKAAGMPKMKTGTAKTRNLTQVTGLVLRNVGIEMRGKDADRIVVRNNILLDGAPGTDYLLVTHGSYKVERNILLREIGQAGRGIVTYKTHDSEIRHNHIGDLSRRALLEAKVSGMRTQYAKIDELTRRKVLPTTRTGDFVTGVNVLNGDSRITLTQNLIHGERSLNARTRDGNLIRRDHALYAKGYDGMRIEGNLFQGWLNDASGGVKVRNGNGASIVSNVFDDVGLLLYVYSDFPDNKDWRLTNTLILDNLYIGRTNAGEWGSGFSYTQDFYNSAATKSIVRENLIAHNEFRVHPGDRLLIDERRLGVQTKEAFALYANRLENGKPIPGGISNVTERQHRLIQQAIDPLAQPLPRLAD